MSGLSGILENGSVVNERRGSGTQLRKVRLLVPSISNLWWIQQHGHFILRHDCSQNQLSPLLNYMSTCVTVKPKSDHGILFPLIRLNVIKDSDGGYLLVPWCHRQTTLMAGCRQALAGALSPVSLCCCIWCGQHLGSRTVSRAITVIVLSKPIFFLLPHLCSHCLWRCVMSHSRISHSRGPSDVATLDAGRQAALLKIDNAKFSCVEALSKLVRDLWVSDHSSRRWIHVKIVLVAGVGFFTDAYVPLVDWRKLWTDAMLKGMIYLRSTSLQPWLEWSMGLVCLELKLTASWY